MKKLIMIICLFAVAGILTTTAAQDNTKKATAKKEAVKPVEGKKIFNKYCPIMEDEVDPKVQTVEHKGKLIGFCCKKCVNKFKANPDKYMKHISADGKSYVK